MGSYYKLSKNNLREVAIKLEESIGRSLTPVQYCRLGDYDLQSSLWDNIGFKVDEDKKCIEIHHDWFDTPITYLRLGDDIHIFDDGVSMLLRKCNYPLGGGYVFLRLSSEQVIPF